MSGTIAGRGPTNVRKIDKYGTARMLWPPKLRRF